MAWCSVEFAAMGSPCSLVADDRELAALGVRRVHELEALWSRFVPSSEVSLLNAVAGSLSVVSAETFELVSRAQRARELTSGVFNPLLGAHMVALGYDRPWPLGSVDGPVVVPPVPLQPIELFAEVSAVCLPAGSVFDPGGVGKGLAADLVVAELLAAGSSSVQVSLGGDVRVGGPGWGVGGWQVLLDPGLGLSALSVGLPLGGGVATSSVLRRRWVRDGRWVHHLVDPGSGVSAVSPLVSVSVVAAELWWAEVVAKVALIEGSAGVVERFGLSGVVWPVSGVPMLVSSEEVLV